MITGVKLAAFVLALTTACSAQDGLTVQNRGNQKWPAAEAEKIYRSACAVVQHEFGRTLPLAPPVMLVVGADKNVISFTGREIRLTKWDRRAFAQGVVWLAFEDLMPSQERLAMTTRALNWADSTVEVEQLEK